MNIAILALVLYITFYNAILWLVDFSHKKLVIERAQNQKNTSEKELPKRLKKTWKEYKRFTRKDTRPSKIGLTNKQLFYTLHLIGLLTAPIAAYFQQYTIAVISLTFPIIALVYSNFTAKPIINERARVLLKMANIGRILGYSTKQFDEPEKYIKITEWNDFVKPGTTTFEIPATFSSDSEETFLRLFNQNFGTVVTFVPHNSPEENIIGWDYEKSLLTLKPVPPLPKSALFHKRYIEDPGVAWSSFPIALGVENGIEIMNEETGEMENVLAFDVSGEQQKISEKLGRQVSPSIVTSPMALVAGATGGGKALSSDTKIRIIPS